MTQIQERDPQSYAIIGAAMVVHRGLGHGFLEGVYQEALELELQERGVPFQREAEVPIRYKGQTLKTRYRPDFICYDRIVVELKALPQTGGPEEAQVINYLKASGYPLGLLLNFGTASLTYRRFAGLQSVSSVKSVD